MKKTVNKIILLIITFFAINSISFAQSSIECEKENQKLRKTVRQLRSQNTRLKSQQKKLETNIVDTTRFVHRIDDLKYEINTYQYHIKRLNDSLYYLRQSLKYSISKESDIKDSISRLESKYQIISNQLLEKNSMIDSLTSMSDEEKRKWAELETQKIENKIEEEEQRHILKRDTLEIENEHLSKLQEIRHENEEIQLERDINNQNEIRELNREREYAVAESLKVERERELAIARSKLPEHFCLSLGGSLGWMYGSIKEKYITFNINDYSLNFKLGYWLDEPYDYERGTLIGLFIDIGNTNSNGINNIDKKYSMLKIESINPYYEFQIGLLLSEIFVFDIGYGKQEININESNQKIKPSEYYCFDIGLYIPITQYWDIGLKSDFSISNDIYKVSARFNLNSNIKLSFWKW